MDPTIFQYISSLGFPIVACAALAWFVMHQLKENNEEIKNMRKEHTEEVFKMTEALNKNTQAIQLLTMKLDKED